jgi:hypothetical protein
MRNGQTTRVRTTDKRFARVPISWIDFIARCTGVQKTLEPKGD